MKYIANDHIKTIVISVSDTLAVINSRIDLLLIQGETKTVAELRRVKADIGKYLGEMIS